MLERASEATRFDDNPIFVAGRLGDDEEARVADAPIEDLMRRQRRNGETGRWREPMFFTVELDDELAGQHVEELCCMLMKMKPLGSCGRHTFFDDAE